MKRKPTPIRVIIVDDHPLVQEGLDALLATMGIEVVAVAATAAEAAAAVTQTPADAAVVDLTLEEGSGFEVLEAICRVAPQVKAVVYSVHEDGERVRRALSLGARGYVTKREKPALLAECLRRVCAGEQFLSPRIARHMIAASDRRTLPLPDEALSAQEMQVYTMAGRGFGAQEIADQLGLSVTTIDTYFKRIVFKLNLTGRREMQQHANEWVRLNDKA